MAGIAALLLLVPLPLAAPPFEEVTIRGQAVLLPAVIEGLGLAADPAPMADQVVIRTDDGQVIPLLSDPASRALFIDERLRDRAVEIRGRRFEGLPYMLATSFRVEQDGAWRTPEYYCDVCTISVRAPEPCPCCQGTMDLRMRPEDP